MAWRIGDQVSWGELDNRIIGKVTGTIVLTRRAEPLRLQLKGNPYRDWAGCLLRFKNATPEPGDLLGLVSEQEGLCGDMTASRKVRMPPEPIQEWLESGAPGKESLPWGNSVYLEWFSETNGRVVVESTRFQVEVSEPAWIMTEAQEREQEQQSMEAMQQFMTALASATRKPVALATPLLMDTDSDDAEAERTLRTISEIENLKAKARELSGGQLLEGSGEHPLPLDIQRQFWENVVSFEGATLKVRREILAEDGIQARAEADLSEPELTVELWRLIRGLAHRRVYLDGTDHLSDRELYKLLVEQVLEEETEVFPPEAGWNYHIFVHEYGVPGDEDGTNLYLRYYADEGTRARWVKDFQDEIPEHCDPPFDRDRFLPREA